MDDKDEKNLFLRFKDQFDSLYVGQTIFELFKKDRFGRVELIVYSACALILAGVISAVAAIAISHLR